MAQTKLLPPTRPEVTRVSRSLELAVCSLRTVVPIKINSSRRKRKRESTLEVSCNNKETCLCPRCKHYLLAAWLGCACPSCQPDIYQDIGRHTRGRHRVHDATGLERRKHDAWLLATCLVESLIAQEPSPSITLASKCWGNSRWARLTSMSHPFSKYYPLSESLTDDDLQEAAGVFNEFFFLGLLPDTRLQVKWNDLPAKTLGHNTSSGSTQVIELNRKSARLQCSIEQIIQVIIHEMIHAFFGYYACYPWTNMACATGPCGKRWHANLGTGGHGRAWQHVAKAIEDVMPTFLRFAGNLGRMDGLIYDSQLLGWCLPCPEDLLEIYPNRSECPIWWERRIRTSDDDVACDSILKKQRRRLTKGEVMKGGRARAMSIR